MVSGLARFVANLNAIAAFSELHTVTRRYNSTLLHLQNADIVNLPRRLIRLPYLFNRPTSRTYTLR